MSNHLDINDNNINNNNNDDNINNDNNDTVGRLITSLFDNNNDDVLISRSKSWSTANIKTPDEQISIWNNNNNNNNNNIVGVRDVNNDRPRSRDDMDIPFTNDWPSSFAEAVQNNDFHSVFGKRTNSRFPAPLSNINSDILDEKKHSERPYTAEKERQKNIWTSTRPNSHSRDDMDMFFDVSKHNNNFIATTSNLEPVSPDLLSPVVRSEWSMRVSLSSNPSNNDLNNNNNSKLSVSNNNLSPISPNIRNLAPSPNLSHHSSNISNSPRKSGSSENFLQPLNNNDNNNNVNNANNSLITTTDQIRQIHVALASLTPFYEFRVFLVHSKSECTCDLYQGYTCSENVDPLHLSILNTEGCASCGSTINFNSQYHGIGLVVLMCKTLGCVHILHTNCALNGYNNHKSPSHILPYHTQEYTRSVIGYHIPNSNMAKLSMRGRISYDIRFLHIIGDLLICNLNGISTNECWYDSNNTTGLEYVQMYIGRSSPLFLSHARIECHCIAEGTGEQWYFEALYDLRNVNTDNNGNINIILVDKTLSVSLIMDLTRSEDKTNKSCWRIIGIRMELMSSHQVPQMLHYSQQSLQYGNQNNLYISPINTSIPNSPSQLPKQTSYVAAAMGSTSPNMNTTNFVLHNTKTNNNHLNHTMVNNNNNNNNMLLSSSTTSLSSNDAKESGRIAQPPAGVDGSEEVALLLDLLAENGYDSLEAMNSADVNALNISDEVNEKVRIMIKGKISILSRTQFGSRFLQYQLGRKNVEMTTMIYNEIYDAIDVLMIDLFGNYLCQTLMSYCSDEQLKQILEKLIPRLHDIACHRQGTRAVQRFVRTIRNIEDHVTMMQVLQPHLLTLFTHQSGSHVVLSMLDSFPENMRHDLVSKIIEETPRLAIDQFGLCILKQVLTTCSEQEFSTISNIILDSLFDLANHRYGNYIVQYLLQQKNKTFNRLLHQRLMNNYVELSKYKFSSNVVEACLQLGDDEWRREITNELVANGDETIVNLLKDSYGNYVMQNALSVADRTQAERLANLIRPHLGKLKTNISKKWERLLSQTGNEGIDGQIALSPDHRSRRYSRHNNRRRGRNRRGQD